MQRLSSFLRQNKSLKKSKKSIKAPMSKSTYHKRVKSDQIYSIKLLLKNEDRAKSSKKKVAS